MKVSVVIPVYNVERYLARCLDSVLAAAERLVAAGHEAEVICVDDGSTDGSAGVLARYADRVRIVTKGNGGLGSARNAGLAVLTGDYVTFVDSDDFVPPNALSRFAEVASASGAALVVSMSFAIDVLPSPGRGNWKLRPSAWIAGRKVQYSACNKLFRADLVRDRPFPRGAYEDFSWTTGIFCDVRTFVAVDEPLYVYCRNAGAVSIVRSAFTAGKMRDSLAAVRRVLEQAASAVVPEAAAFARRQAADGLSSTVGQVCKSGDRVLAAEFLAELDGLVGEYPFLMGRLTFKARLRLWRMRRRNMV